MCSVAVPIERTRQLLISRTCRRKDIITATTKQHGLHTLDINLMYNVQKSIKKVCSNIYPWFIQCNMKHFVLIYYIYHCDRYCWLLFHMHIMLGLKL